MTQTLITLFAALGGAIIGAVTSIATTWFQNKSIEKRDRSRLAVETAVRDFQSAESFAKFMAEKNKMTVQTYDLAYYVVLHSKLAHMLEDDNALTPENWVKAHEAALELSSAGQRYYEERKAQQKAQADAG